MTCARYALSILVRFARRENLQGRDEEEFRVWKLSY
jgi:hypothetical protein